MRCSVFSSFTGISVNRVGFTRPGNGALSGAAILPVPQLDAVAVAVGAGAAAAAVYYLGAVYKALVVVGWLGFCRRRRR